MQQFSVAFSKTSRVFVSHYQPQHNIFLSNYISYAQKYCMEQGQVNMAYGDNCHVVLCQKQLNIQDCVGKDFVMVKDPVIVTSHFGLFFFSSHPQTIFLTPSIKIPLALYFSTYQQDVDITLHLSHILMSFFFHWLDSGVIFGL